MPNPKRLIFECNFFVDTDGKKVIVIRAVPLWGAYALREGLDYKVQTVVPVFTDETAWDTIDVFLKEDNGALTIVESIDESTLLPIDIDLATNGNAIEESNG